VTADDLRRAELAYQETLLLIEPVREARNHAIREALDAGWTHAQIAEATGLTRGRIGQIAQR
jgi:hypothetical protein